MDASGLSPWLFDASYDAVGDLAETIALVLPPPVASDDSTLSHWIEVELAPLAGLPAGEVRMRLANAWQRLDRDERFVFGKLITGSFRVGAAKQLVLRALAQTLGVAVGDVAQRLVGDWVPAPSFFDRLRGDHDATNTAVHRPYPFFLAHALQTDPATLGDPRAVAGRMEVGRHSRPGARARRWRKLVVARRRAGERQRFPNSSPLRTHCPAGRSSTARSSPGGPTAQRRCRSRPCSSGSIARHPERVCCVTSPSRSSPTTCSSMKDATSATCRWCNDAHC